MDDFVVAALLEETESTQRNQLKWLRDHSNPYELPENQFKKFFRLPQGPVLNLFQQLNTNHDMDLGPIPGHLKLLCALSFFGHGSYQTHVGQQFLLAQSQASISRSLDYVCKLIIQKITPREILFPTSARGQQHVMQKFHEIHGMQNVIGIIDCTHVAIASPQIHHPTAPALLFYNRKGFYSINCQMVCDAERKIINIKADFPGSTHDAAILQASNLNDFLQSQYVRGVGNRWLLGDKGYPLLPWLMTPFEQPATIAEENYNYLHTQARNTIEVTFGTLKNKFRCLKGHRVLHYSPKKATSIILASSTVYNIYLKSAAGDSDDDSSSEDAEDQVRTIQEEPESEEIENREREHNEENNFLNDARIIRAQIAQAL